MAYVNELLWGRSRYEYSYPYREPHRCPKAATEADPEDVQKRAKDRIERLRRSIATAEQQLVKDKAELAYWEKVAAIG